ncbi:MAG: DUF3299 domain-containing protein [Phycisphaerales bacterium]|jgi:hypothetical protein|nr:DUF3299 domain-containing protein [Phycisphaerales bacterium]
MRTFWAVLLTLTIAGLVWLAIGPVRSGGDASLVVASSDEIAPAPPADDSRAQPGSQEPASPKPAVSQPAPPAPTLSEPTSSEPDAAQGDLPTLDQTLGLASEDGTSRDAAPSVEHAAPSTSVSVEAAPGESASPAAPSEAVAPAPSTNDTLANAPQAGPAATGPTPTPVSAEAINRVRTSGPRSTSGAKTRVGRFDLPGAGTDADPVEVPWELLVSAMEDYRPREGKTELPQWAKGLNGKHVRITGFVLFPTFGTQARELLLMKNQWDGCCIGVPPTPYDAIEITLSKPVDLANTTVNYASISGVLQVDPYLVNGWLLGLYLMENATLETIGGSGAGGY